MTNGADSHGRTGGKKSGSKKAKGKAPKSPSTLKTKGMIPSELAAAKSR